MNKKGQGNILLVLLVVGLVAAFAVGSQQGWWDGEPAELAAAPLAAVAPSECSKEDVLLKPSAVRLGRAGTSADAPDEHYVFLNGIQKGHVDATTGLTVSTFQDIRVLYNENSTTYYSVVFSGNTGCTDPYEVQAKAPLADTSVTSFVHNPDGTVNSDSNDLALGADDVQEVDFTYKASRDEYWGNPALSNENVITCEYDKTYVQKVDIAGLRSAPTPGAFTFTSNQSGSGNDMDGEDSFYIPNVGNGGEQKFSLEVDTTSSAPGEDEANVLCHAYDANYDIDQDTGAIISGVEDEDDNSLALASFTQWVYAS